MFCWLTCKNSARAKSCFIIRQELRESYVGLVINSSNFLEKPLYKKDVLIRAVVYQKGKETLNPS